jgi:hypothetical protein
MGQAIPLRLHVPSIVVRTPIAYERLDHRKLHALRLISGNFSTRPSSHRGALAKVAQRFLRTVDTKEADRVALSSVSDLSMTRGGAQERDDGLRGR